MCLQTNSIYSSPDTFWPSHSPTSEPSQAHLKTSLLLLSDSSLASRPEGRRGERGEEVGREAALF